MADSNPLPEPLSQKEIAHYRALAAQGGTPPLSIIQRFIATIRKSYLSSPKAIEKSKTPRTAKPTSPTDEQVDFF